MAIDYFLTDQNDLIGWTYENYYGAISVSYNNAATSFFMKIKNSNYPTVGTTYTFDKIHLPAYFSIAVRIQGCPPWRKFKQIRPPPPHLVNHLCYFVCMDSLSVNHVGIIYWISIWFNILFLLSWHIRSQLHVLCLYLTACQIATMYSFNLTVHV